MLGLGQNEFIELLVLQILDPVAKRFVEAPSQSRLYLFPRLLDKCISVVIEYVKLCETSYTISRLSDQ